MYYTFTTIIDHNTHTNMFYVMIKMHEGNNNHKNVRAFQQ
jgi:hypothetical protein